VRALQARRDRTAATIVVVIFVVLVLELTSTRLYAYIGSTHGTAIALSSAVLGLGLGAWVRAHRGERVAPGRTAPWLPASLLVVVAAATAGAPLAWLAAASVPTFTLAGLLVADAFATRGRHRIGTGYALDLLAAAAGCVVAPRLIGWLAPTEIVAALGVLAAGWALAVVERPRLVVAAALGLVHAGVLVAGRTGALPDGALAALLRADLGAEKALAETGATAADVLDSAWSPLGRLDVVRVPGDDARLGVFTDGMSPTFLVRAAEARAGAFDDTWGLLAALPYRALRPGRVLILGAGAGASVWTATRHGATQVDGVEVNPAMPALLARWREFTGDVYGQPGVRLIIADARRYLTDTAERYDLIELALALTGNVHAQPAGLEAHLYTVEAVGLYLRRLTPGGALVFIHSDPGNAYRQLVTALVALAATGRPRDRALDGIAVLHDPRPGTAYRYLLVVAPGGLALDVVEALDVEPAELLWGPGDPPERAAQLLDRARLGATAADDLAPVHDDRPYFFQNTRGLWATARAQPGRLWALGGAAVLGGLLLFGRRRDPRRFGPPAVVAVGLGAAFMAVELALIQRFTLAAGGTLYAVSVVLFGLLAWCALGAWVVSPRWQRRARGLAGACLTAAVVVAGSAWAVRDLAWLEAIADDRARFAVIAALLAPLGLALGCPFPVLVAREGEPAPRIASLWALSGVASLAGATLATLALRVVGATDTLGLAAGAYLAVAAVAWSPALTVAAATTPR
jgi:hypothetical protein